MTTNWFLYNKRKNFKEIAQKFGITALTSVILCNREIYDDEEIKKILSEDVNDLNDASLMPDVDKASDILHTYISKKKSIRIVGDYDIDGVCSTYILYDAIKRLGANVSYAIPDRISDGYGINNGIIEKAINDRIDLIITCDNGIAAAEQISYAKKKNIEVIVTDHHDISELPKDAAAIINPKRKDVENPYPFENICGGVVAWKFMMRYYELYEDDKKFIIEQYLEFAMLATIGDIMPLVNENHIIAKIGLKKILSTKNQGLKKLLEVTGIDFDKKDITTYHVGFIIGPLINAAGRMDKATLALKLFLSDDANEIDEIAKLLKDLNDERKTMTENGTKLAIDMIESKYKDDKVIVIFAEELKEQVAGIVAGRIKEKYNKPTIILTNTMENDEAKASCRSIDTYDIFEALSVHKEMFSKFGGHRLAAGFSMAKNDIDKLRTLLNSECKLTDDDFILKIHIDAEFPFYCFDLNLMNELMRLEPYGQSFQTPLFATKDVKCNIKNVYGINKNVIKLSLSKDSKELIAVAFTEFDAIKDRLDKKDLIDIVYKPKINEFRGQKSIEINVVEYR
ncbi:MAG: single-stranded-DNA-specific exonuclease RecJ [Lachnospiraceae bacterium]|nr:single-stranded-DNA-specific exonuclease RecJ [Lachnospiraceae bacterium]